MSAFQSILLITSQPTTSIQRYFNIDLNINHLDHLIVQSDKTIGIDLIRQLKLFAQSRPVIKPQKFIIIPEAERLTPEAQNALLKLLEEPPDYLQIILTITNAQQLLDTVLSRCRIITDQVISSTTSASDTFQNLLASTSADRLNNLPPTTSKEAALTFLVDLIAGATIQMHYYPCTETSHNLQLLLSCQARLNQNANPTLAITDAVLSLLPLPANPATMAHVTREKN